MGLLVINGAMLQCTMGMSPGTLTVLPTNKCCGTNLPAANIMDSKPMANIGTFGMCQSPANPQVAAATAAAMGVLTPMPCVPNTPGPWGPGAAISKIANLPALDNASMCQCAWAGTITVTNAGQTKIVVS